MPAVIALAAVALLGITGLAGAAALRIRSSVELALAAFVLAFAEVVALVVLLSPFDAVRREVLLGALVVVAAAVLALWWRLGRPRPELPRLGAALRRSPPLLVLSIVVGLALAYVLALLVGTAPTTWDSLVYHLTRAALWRQDGAIGYIEGTYDDRLNSNPPNAEIALTFVLELTRDEHFAGFVQLFSVLACVLGIAALGRRLGLARREAAFGALLFLTLPIVVLQASTTQNDFVVAALLVAATVFVLGRSRAEVGLAALAVAVALGTKVTAVFALPLLAVVVLVGTPRAAHVRALGAVAVGALAGSWWYLVNLVEAGDPLGEGVDTDLVTVGELSENLLAAFARVLDAFDLSGAEGTDRFVIPGLLDSDLFAFVLVALGLALVLLVTRRGSPRLALAAGALALLPLAVAPLGYALWRGFAKLHDVVGSETETLPAGEWPPQVTASESLSWFGPLGLALAVAGAAAGLMLHRRGALPALAVVVAAAPLAWLVLFSLSIGYDTWQGRFFVYPVALSAALWGLVLRVRPAAWAAVAVGATTVTLALVNSLEKPSGIELFADRETASIWNLTRWEQQSLGRQPVAPVLRFLDERVPEDATVALALGEDDFGFPAFGPRLQRTVLLVDAGATTGEIDAQWLVVSPERLDDVDAACWSARLESGGGSVFERSPRCPLPPPG